MQVTISLPEHLSVCVSVRNSVLTVCLLVSLSVCLHASLPACLQSKADDVAAVMQADVKAIESCLSEGSIGMSRAIMEAIASGSVTTVVDVQRFVKCTLLAATSDFQVSFASLLFQSLYQGSQPSKCNSGRSSNLP